MAAMQEPAEDPARISSDQQQQQQEQRAQQIRVKNRRKTYLDKNPSYFSSSTLELADPLFYDRMIRRFQTPAEREAEGRAKGYSGVLEADLMRSEAKLAALADPRTSSVTYERGPRGEIYAEDPRDAPADKEEGRVRWAREMTERFLRGEDEDFDYTAVDANERWDDHVLEEREAEEKWFTEEEPRWIVDEEGLDGGAGNGDERAARDDMSARREVRGETGIQDF